MANTIRRTAQLEMKRVGKDHRRTFELLRSLAKDRSIIITRPDKGRGVVILDRADYLKKMYTILDDPQSFRQIETRNHLALGREIDHSSKKNEERRVHLRRRILTRHVRSAPCLLASTDFPSSTRPIVLFGQSCRPTKTVGYGLGQDADPTIGSSSPDTIRGEGHLRLRSTHSGFG